MSRRLSSAESAGPHTLHTSGGSLQLLKGESLGLDVGTTGSLELLEESRLELGQRFGIVKSLRSHFRCYLEVEAAAADGARHTDRGTHI